MPNDPKTNEKDEKNYSKWSKKSAEKKKVKNVVFKSHPLNQNYFFFSFLSSSFIEPYSTTVKGVVINTTMQIIDSIFSKIVDFNLKEKYKD